MAENTKPELDLTNIEQDGLTILKVAKPVAEANGLNWEYIEKEATRKDFDHLMSVLNDNFSIVYYHDREGK